MGSIKKNSFRIKTLVAGFALILFTAGLLLYFSRGSKADRSWDDFNLDPAFSGYISSYTAGVISASSAIQIVFTENMIDSAMVGSRQESLFSTTPSSQGEAFWIDRKTIEYKPARKLKQGTRYRVEFALGKIAEVPQGLETLRFGLQTIAQHFDVQVENLLPVQLEQLEVQQLTGSLSTSDFSEMDQVEKMLKAVQDGQNLEVSWDHPDGKTHRFTVHCIARKEKAGKIQLQFDGEPLEIEQKEQLDLEIPALGDFKLMQARVIQAPDQYLELIFSDPLIERQDLEGLVEIEDIGDLQLQIDLNKILVYPQLRQTGTRKLTIHPGIRNSRNFKLTETINLEVKFEQVKPAVRFTGKGVILPDNPEGLIFPFEAVNLRAVDLTLIKIYEKNIAQFLQINDLNGSEELRRVGIPVLQQKISLEASGITDFNKWNRFSINLSEYLKEEPGALYQVRLSFKPGYSTYFCEQEFQDELTEPEFRQNDQEFNRWDSYQNYYYPSGYDWDERENPCHVSYYTSDRSVQRNLMTSNLGLMAKLGTDNQLLVTVTDLITTLPKSNVAVQVLNYQQRVIESGITDLNGMSKLETGEKPFMILASFENQRGYLRLMDGDALSLSNFEVSGQKVEKGLKGFLYGERGVWRPGDSLHLNFMLEQNQELPENHPVVFELINPKGQTENRQVKTSGLKGVYYFGTGTRPDAVTGTWQAKVSVGGTSFELPLKIETVKPNRLKIDLQAPDKNPATAPKSIPLNLKVNWLHGTPARNLKVVYDLVLQPVKTTFQGFNNYVFDDPSKKFTSETRQVFEGRLDESGEASFTAEVGDLENASGALNARFLGKVFEEGGDFSIDQKIIPFLAFDYFAGIKAPDTGQEKWLQTDTLQKLELVSLRADGKPADRTLQVEVFKLEWRWWWDNSYDYQLNYLGNQNFRPVANSQVKTVNGKGSFSFRIDYPEWGRYFVRATDLQSGHSSGTILYFDWPSWADHGNNARPGGETMLSLTSDKGTYQVGEKIDLIIPGSNNGRAFISIENGSRVLETFWTEVQPGLNHFPVPVSPEMSPNIYAHVTLIQPHAQSVNDLPIRLYGILPLNVENPGSHLKPELILPESLQPEQQFTVKVKEAEGNAMVYTLAMVDEGLLDLTRFQTPDPWNHFQAREALGVQTWDLYDQVCGAFSGTFPRLLAIGGDDANLNPASARANRFKPVVKYAGPFYLEKGKTASHNFRMPQYVGSVRFMVVAGSEGAYGHTEKAVPVKQDLMILATLPRVLSPEEEVRLPVNLFVSDPKIRQVKLRLETNDLVVPQGGSSQVVEVQDSENQVAFFNLRVKGKTGIAKIKVTAESGGIKAYQDIELTVRIPEPPVVNVEEKILNAGEKWELQLSAFGIEGTNTAGLEVSGVPPLNFGKRLQYLTSYPHGCLEQVISGGFPQLYLADVTDLDQATLTRIEQNVKGTIDKLLRFQTESGGFAYWPGQLESSEWGTTYAGHFLLEAQQKGYKIPPVLLKKWVRYQKKAAGFWKPNTAAYTKNDLIQAYRLYTLALANEAETGAMNRLREMPRLSVTARWRLAAAYLLSGQKEAANNLVNGAAASVEPYQELYGTFGSDLRDEAMILETLGLMGEQTRGMALLQKISGALADENRWLSTQTTAYCLISATKFIQKEARSETIRFNLKINDAKAVTAQTDLAFARKKLILNPDGSGKISLENTGSGVLYARVIREGVVLNQPTEAVESNLKLDVIYKDKENNLLDPENLPQGADLVAEVTVFNPGYRGDLQQLALTQVFPSGWEIVNTRLQELDQYTVRDVPDYLDIRDDRVYTYFDLKAGKRKTFKILLNSSYSGSYFLPSVKVEAMYDHSIQAVQPGKEVVVYNPVFP